jgi:hypothetical protein
MQVSHGIYFRWTFFETEATVEIRSYPQMAPTADMCNMVRVPSQVYVKRDGYRLVAFPARLEKPVIEDQTDDPTPFGYRANDFVAQVPVRWGQGSGIRV